MTETARKISRAELQTAPVGLYELPERSFQRGIFDCPNHQFIDCEAVLMARVRPASSPLPPSYIDVTIRPDGCQIIFQWSPVVES